MQTSFTEGLLFSQLGMHIWAQDELFKQKKKTGKRQVQVCLTILESNNASKQSCQSVAKLQVKLTICFCIAHELRMVFTFFNG